MGVDSVRAVEPDEQSPDDEQSAAPIAEASHADMVANARRRHGAAGAMLAAGLVAMDDLLMGRPVKEQAPVVVANPTEPHDVDRDGITVPIDEEKSVYAPPQPPPDPFPRRPRRR